MQANSSRDSLRTTAIAIAFTATASLAGCAEEVVLQSLMDAPDGTAEVLRVDPSSTDVVQHEPVAFLDAVLRNDRVVLVDFWGPHCGPCVHMAPELEKVARQFPDQVSVVKVDVEQSVNANLAIFFDIQGIPDVRVYVDGKAVDGIYGYADAREIVNIIEPHIASLEGRDG